MLGVHGQTSAPSGSAASADESPSTLEDIQRRHILSVLKSTDWVIQGADAAADILDLRPSTLRSLMQRLRIARDRVEEPHVDP